MMRVSRQIGLDIGNAWVKAAMRDRSGRMARIAAFPRLNANAAVDDGEATFIAETLLRQGFVPAPIVLGMCAQDVRLEEIEAPNVLDEVALDRIILGEIGRLSRWEPGSFTGQWWQVPTPVRAGATGTYLSVAAPRSTIDALVGPLSTVGFDVMAVDLLAAATARVCSRGADEDHLVVSVNIGCNSTEIAASLEHKLVFVRRLAGIGLAEVSGQLPDLPVGRPILFENLCRGDFMKSPASHAVIAQFGNACHSLTETLREELDRTLAYVARRFSSATRFDVFVCGGGARIATLMSALAQSPEVLAKRAELPTSVPQVTKTWKDEPICIAACGLALWGEDPT